MFKESGLITYYSLTPVHVGAGSSVSYIDLPVQRERHTSFPMMAGSGLKGVFRALAERDDNFKNNVNLIFGPEDGSEGSSCAAFTDAKILLYPVRSVKNVFAWITCPCVLKRLKEDLEIAGLQVDNFTIPNLNNEDCKIIVLNGSKLKIDNNKVGLEEFVFDIDSSQNNNLENLINEIKNYIPDTETAQNLKDRFAIVSDNVFTDLVNYAVEVRTRIRIDQTTGTAQSGALFTVEMVPSESIFYSLVFTDDPKNNNQNNNDLKDANSVMEKIKKLIDNKVIQFGGDETIGLGFAKVKFTEIKTNQGDNKKQSNWGNRNDRSWIPNCIKN